MLSHPAMQPTGDAFLTGWEKSPLVRAYRAVAHVLLLVWKGDIGSARQHLIRAATTLPLAMPFDGLGVVLARRLDLAVIGEIGPVARALTAAFPCSTRIDGLVDEALRAFLAGSFDVAAGYSSLWVDLDAPGAVFSVPGADEVAAIADARPVPRGVETPEIALTRTLIARVAGASDARWRSEREELMASVRTLRSPFARGRVEVMIGTKSAIRDETAAAAAHFRTARSLFEVAGASAWARAVDERLVRLDPHDAGVGADPLTACRAAWGQILTAREVEVAMTAAGGASNRDIASSLSVSIRTVEVHLGRAFAKLDVRNRVELTVLAHRTSQHL